MRPDGEAAAGRRNGSVLKNTFFLAVADAAGRLVSLFFFTLAARRLGVARFGVLTFSLAFVNMFAVLSDLGIGNLAVREVARDRSSARGFVNRGISVRITASIVVAALVVVAAALMDYPGPTLGVVAICATTVISGGVILFYGNVLLGFERNSYTALARIAQTAMMITGALLIMTRKPSVASYAWIIACAGTLAAAVVSVVVWTRFVPPGLDFDIRRWLPMLRASAPFGLATILVALYYWSGPTILSKLANEKAVGEFGAAYRLVAGVGFLGASFASAVYPVISRVYASEPHRWSAAASRALRLTLSLAVPQAVLGVALAGPVIEVLYGAGYQGAVRVMTALTWWGGCATVNSMLSNMLFASDRQRLVTKQAAISVGVSLVLNFLLVPSLGALGAAVALSAAEAAGMAFLLAGCYRMPQDRRAKGVVSSLGRSSAAAAFAGALAVMCARWLPWVGIALALPAYLVFLKLCGGIQREDLETVRMALRRANA